MHPAVSACHASFNPEHCSSFVNHLRAGLSWAVALWAYWHQDPRRLKTSTPLQRQSAAASSSQQHWQAKHAMTTL